MGNPAALHSLGLEARASLDGARAKVARLVGGPAAGVIFTASATEANNLAIRGVTSRATGRHVVTSAVEHVSIRNPLPRPRKAGMERDLVAGRRRRHGRSRGRRQRPAARHGARLDHGRQRRDRHAAARARDRPRWPARQRRALSRRRRRRRRAAAARRGRRRDRSAHDLVERSLRAAGRRRALGPARGSPGADRPRRRAGGRRALGHREPAGDRRHGRGRRPRTQRARGRGRAPVAAARPPAGGPARAGQRRAAHRRPRRPTPAASRQRRRARREGRRGPLGARPPRRRRLVGLGLQPHHRRALARAARDRLRPRGGRGHRSASRSAGGRLRPRWTRCWTCCPAS